MDTRDVTSALSVPIRVFSPIYGNYITIINYLLIINRSKVKECYIYNILYYIYLKLKSTRTEQRQNLVGKMSNNKGNLKSLSGNIGLETSNQNVNNVNCENNNITCRYLVNIYIIIGV